MRAKSRRFGDLSPREQLVASVAIAISAALVVVAERDIHRRPSAQIRGDKLVWRLASLNALGAVAYLSWGRRRET